MLYFAMQPSVPLLAYNFYLLKFSVSLLNWTFSLLYPIYIKLTYINTTIYVLHF